MLGGSWREVDSVRQRQQFVAPPGVRGPRSHGGDSWQRENQGTNSFQPSDRYSYVLGGGFYRQYNVSDQKKASCKQKYCSSLEFSLLLRSERFPRRTQGTTSVTMKEAVRPVGQPVRRCRVGLCLVWSALPERKVNNSRWRSPPRAPGLALAARRFASIRDAREFLELDLRWSSAVYLRCTVLLTFVPTGYHTRRSIPH